jgi:hypothetical protein
MSASRAGAIWKDESSSGSCRQPRTKVSGGVRCGVWGQEARWLAALILAAVLLAAFAWPSRAGAQLARPCQVGLPNSLLTVATGGRTITLRESSLDAKLRDSTTLSCRYHYKGGIFSVRVSRYRTPALAARQFRSLCKTARPAAIGSHSCLQDLRGSP